MNVRHIQTLRNVSTDCVTLLGSISLFIARQEGLLFFSAFSDRPHLFLLLLPVYYFISQNPFRRMQRRVPELFGFIRGKRFSLQLN